MEGVILKLRKGYNKSLVWDLKPPGGFRPHSFNVIPQKDFFTVAI
jgi:hypothetical protein